MGPLCLISQHLHLKPMNLLWFLYLPFSTSLYLLPHTPYPTTIALPPLPSCCGEKHVAWLWLTTYPRPSLVCSVGIFFHTPFATQQLFYAAVQLFTTGVDHQTRLEERTLTARRRSTGCHFTADTRAPFHSMGGCKTTACNTFSGRKRRWNMHCILFSHISNLQSLLCSSVYDMGISAASKHTDYMWLYSCLSTLSSGRVACR